MTEWLIEKSFFFGTQPIRKKHKLQCFMNAKNTRKSFKENTNAT